MFRPHLLDGLLVGALAGSLLFAGGVLLGVQAKAKEGDALFAVIDRKNTELDRLDLTKAPEIETAYVIEGLKDHLLLVYKKGAIRVKEADCPQKTCQKQGWIEKPGEMIVCAHYGVIIRLCLSSPMIDTRLGT